ncbi:MAG TPA: DDE-type integrase/transposase/recombinase, partial [Candidatus Dojkabacteria bacterium]|nr:DDE-type integrase/transposase/recombinase [Candidatus Dojkabacteria bacterium]
MTTKSEKATFASEVHKRAFKKFERRRVIVHKIDEIWAMDLASLESLVSYNDGYKYMLCIIDVFSKFAWAVALKNKTAATVLAAVKDVVKKSKRIPEKIWVDQGSEFYNKSFKDWIQSHNITMYSTYGESKSVVVERFIRTLKDIATKYFTEHSTRDWVNNLDTFLHEYNNRKHKTIKMTPVEASKPANEEKVKENFVVDGKRKSPQLVKGDKVRISRIKDKFEKGYENNWSYEVFTISEVLNTIPPTYKLIDYFNDPIEGSFYEQELLK